jgi:rhomboid protease GluP
MVIVERLQDGSRVFRASWHSGLVWTALVCVLLAAGAGWTAWDKGLTSQGGLLGLLTLFILGITWLVMWPLFSAVPVLSVGPQGISGFLLKGHTVPWSEISDVQHATVRGHPMVTLVLHEGAPSLARFRSLLGVSTQRIITLGPLHKAEREPALETVMWAFRRFAGTQAQAAAQALKEAAVSEAEFQERLHARTPLTWALYAVMAVNGSVWLLNFLDGMSAMKPASAELFTWGANSTTAVVRDGELWRLLTSTVLHAGVIHLMLNMYALWDAGRQVCRWFGNGQFLLIYLGSALAGSALSLHFSAQQAVSVGASGAVFGVLGALLTGVYQHRERVPKRMAIHLLTSQGLFVAFILVQGFIRPGIDNAAHVGGLVAGSVMAWLLIELVDEQAGEVKRMFRRVIAAFLVVLFVGGLVGTAKPGIDHRQVFALEALVQRVLPRLSVAQSALRRDAQAEKSGRIDRAQLIHAMETRHMPAYRKVGEDLMWMKSTVSEPLWKDLVELQGATLELMALEVGVVRGTVTREQARVRYGSLNARLSAVNERMLRLSTKASHVEGR